ncbi:MAG: chromosomal replication initiator protein DnaA [Chloroflexi bacterium]|nr:MAG: chromosomal replication initiator protein DnaA [Chloroflexota bacterium]
MQNAGLVLFSLPPDIYCTTVFLELRKIISVNPQEIWAAALNQLEMQLDRANYDMWLRDTVCLGFADGLFIIGVPNNFARDMLAKRLYRGVRRVLSDVYGGPVELRFEVHTPVVNDDALEDEKPLFKYLAQQQEEEARIPLHKRIGRPQQPALPESKLNPKYIFERFIVNQANRIAYEAARAVVENPGAFYNPLFIHGGVGLGKTHLLHAIAHAYRQAGLDALFVPSEAFTNDLIDAIRNGTTAMFRERYRRVDALIVDDIQFIAGKESTQEEFFHTFNQLNMYNKQIVLASDRPPLELITLEDRLQSRFAGGLVTELLPSEFETRVAIINMWAQEQSVTLSDDIIRTIAERNKHSIRDLEGMFHQVVARMKLSGKQFDTHEAEDVLDRYHRPREYISVKQVLEVAADYYGLRTKDLIGKRRTARVNHARQVAMYLAREVTEVSYVQIGENFGGRKHTTVMHSCSKIDEQLEYDRTLSLEVKEIQQLLYGR